MRKLGVVLGFVAALSLACGGEDLPEKPQIQADRTAVTFGGAVGEGVYVGQKPNETVQLKNGGVETLVISGVAIEGPQAALFKADVDTKTVQGGQKAFVQVIYAPTEPGKHAAELVVTSNAENGATLRLPITATAVAP